MQILWPLGPDVCWLPVPAVQQPTLKQKRPMHDRKDKDTETVSSDVDTSGELRKVARKATRKRAATDKATKAKTKAKKTAKPAAKKAVARGRPSSRAKGLEVQTEAHPMVFEDDSAIAPQADDRFGMIVEAAYFRAERRSFSPGNELQDWLEAETEVDERLRAQLGEEQA